MSELLSTLAAYVPRDIIRIALEDSAAALSDEPQAKRQAAAVLFADVSGFTPLTEALSQKGPEGAEELTRLLNGYFSRMISLIGGQGGEVVKFSGDAMTAVFPARDGKLGEATRLARQAAGEMQAAMAEFASLDTSAGPIALGMKIGIGAGEILAARVGGSGDRWEYVIAGDPLRQVALAEHQADRGEIALSPEAETVISSQPVRPKPTAALNWDDLDDPAAVEAVLVRFVPSAIVSWLGEDLQEWLAVLRPMSVLFVGVGGLEYEGPDALSQLHAFMRASQETIGRYEGTINKLAVDDKGTILIALFGAPPFAHEDDPERALRCAMDLQLMAQSQKLRLAIGVTTGRVFAGPVGSQSRREYTVMGDTVNLAARLMSAAGAGQVRCDYETYRWAQSELAFEVLAPVRVKGKAGQIRIYRPTGEAGKREEVGGTLIGRKAEVARLAAALDELKGKRGRTRCLVLEGEAGIGKSRLVEELVSLMQARGIAGLKGMGRSIEQQTPYRAWRDIFMSYFDLDEVDDREQRRRSVQEQLGEVVPEMVERGPLLNDVLNLGLPENPLTSSLDTHLRHESLVSLLLALLSAWLVERPLVLVVEDAHWLDSLSWDLTLQAARSLSIARVPLLLVVVTRPMEGAAVRPEATALMKMAITERIPLGSLSPEETLALSAYRLGLDGPLPDEVADLVSARAGGNPFFAEELVYALRDNELISLDTRDGETFCTINQDLAQAARMLPDTIEGIVLSRIDRLQPEEQLTLKVAAVIGRTFGYTTLHDTLGEHMEISQRLLRRYLSQLEALDLTPLEAPEPELSYIFKHIITQEVAYETLLFAQRRQLHRSVAQWYERKFGEGKGLPETGRSESPLSAYYPLLVYHWHQAEDREKERTCARLSGQWAAAQYANAEAVGYLSRALELTSESDLESRFELLLAREEVDDLRGEREAQASDLEALETLVERIGNEGLRAKVALRRANYLEVISDYPAALTAAQQAVESAVRARDEASEAEGYVAWGKTLWRQGHFDAARSPLMLAIDSPHAGADGQYYLGHVYDFQGDHAEAQRHYQQALEKYHAAGNRQKEADTLSVLGISKWESGDFSAGRDYWLQVLTIFKNIGDRRGETLLLNNLGIVDCDLGDHESALERHRQALQLRLTIGDREGEAQSLVNLGLVYHVLGENEAARDHCERALAIQEEIGDRRGQGYSLTYMGHALAALGDLDAAEEAYEKALDLRRELGQQSVAIDDLAGLARVAMARGDLEGAADYVDEILAWIEANGAGGIEYPLQVQLTCYRLLMASAEGDAVILKRAEGLLSQAHAALMEQAEGISDTELRRKFLENVKSNQEIIAAWEVQRSRSRS